MTSTTTTTNADQFLFALSLLLLKQQDEPAGCALATMTLDDGVGVGVGVECSEFERTELLAISVVERELGDLLRARAVAREFVGASSGVSDTTTRLERQFQSILQASANNAVRVTSLVALLTVDSCNNIGKSTAASRLGALQTHCLEQLAVHSSNSSSSSSSKQRSRVGVATTVREASAPGE